MKQSRKPMLCITVAALALTALSACSDGSSSSEDTSTAAEAAKPAAPINSAAETSTPAPKPAMMSNATHDEIRSNDFWWPETLNLSALRANEVTRSNPLGDDFDYAAAFAKVDIEAVKTDLKEILNTSQDWWPADYDHYGPFFIRMAWHSAGTYRTYDGRGGAGGGQQRFEPLNSWPDNANLDKSRRLLWPVKQKYGENISWADLMVLAGTVAMEDMGFKTFGFAGGREDDWQAELVYWGPEQKMLARERFHGDGELRDGLAATQMGLIYVNPEGPDGKPDPVAAGKIIRTAFGRMAMNDEETVALIAGGHTFGKAHGKGKADCVGKEPAAMTVEHQGMGWNNSCGAGNAADTFTSGLEGAWTSSPAQWTHQYLNNLFAFEWEQTRSPAGAIQWVPKDGAGEGMVPDAHLEDVTHQPIMFTTDLALKFDPEYRKIAMRFQENPEEFEDAFARAWFKLTHRDMGPRARYVGATAPAEALIWQDPVPEVDHLLITSADEERLKADILATGLTVPQLVRAAWGSAASFRDTDMRGGANGARIRLSPQKDWGVNNPEELAQTLSTLEAVQQAFNDAQSGNKRVSLADIIVLGGAAAIEKAAADAGHDVTVPFVPGRTDATIEMTDADSFAPLEPEADAFRNYYSSTARLSPSAEMVDRADLLSLTVPEMTVLVGGMRALGANTDGSDYGVLTDEPGTLTNDFFVNLLDMGTVWTPVASQENVYEGRDRTTGDLKWMATEVDLVFGSNAELRAVVEHYAYENAEERFIENFIAAWTKVMQLDRFDIGRT